MRTILSLRLALASSAWWLMAVAPSLAAGNAEQPSAVRDRAARQIVIAYAPASSGAAAAPIATEIAAARASRLAALGLISRRTLADALNEAGVGAARIAGTAGAGIVDNTAGI